MKTLTRIILIAAASLLLVAAVNANSQTNPPPTISGGIEEIADAIGSSTNWTIVAGAGRSFTGNRNVAFGDLVYSFNDNVGLVIGADTLWAPHQDQEREANLVKGGITLKAKIHPFKFLGSGGAFLTNVVCQPFVAEVLATPYGGDSDAVATITTAGVNFDIVKIKNFELVAGAQVENRTGGGFYDGKYGLIHIGLGRRF